MENLFNRFFTGGRTGRAVDFLIGLRYGWLLAAGVAFAVFFSEIIVFGVDLMWGGRMGGELVFAGFITPLLDSLVIIVFLVAVIERLKDARRLMETEAAKHKNTADMLRRGKEELRKSEDEIRKNWEILEKIFGTTHFSMVYLDRNFNFIRVNKAYADACGYPADYFTGKNHFELYPHTENEAIFHKVVETGEPFTITEKPFEFPDHPEWGVTYWDWTLHPLRDPAGNVDALLFVLLDVTERKRSEELVRRSLNEKEVLLKEIHHRVKNNMQVVSSLLLLQSRHIRDETVRGLFNESRNRIHSMSLVHERLYASEDLSHINFGEYTDSLVKEIVNIYNRPDIAVSVNMPGVSLDINTGIPCGLVINELVSNSLKHAFPQGRKGSINVSLDKNSEGMCVLTVADDGTGFPSVLDFRETSSLGLQLVNTLAGQLNGAMELSTDCGTIFKMIFQCPSNGEAERDK